MVQIAKNALFNNGLKVYRVCDRSKTGFWMRRKKNRAIDFLKLNSVATDILK